MKRMRVAQDWDSWRAIDKAELGHRIVLNLSNTKPRLQNTLPTNVNVYSVHVPHYWWSFN